MQIWNKFVINLIESQHFTITIGYYYNHSCSNLLFTTGFVICLLYSKHAIRKLLHLQAYKYRFKWNERIL